MSSTERIWLTPEARDRLQAELTSLLAPTTATPEDASGTSAVDDTRRRATRVRELQELLANVLNAVPYSHHTMRRLASR
jgi:transcription elongation factor GreA